MHHRRRAFRAAAMLAALALMLGVLALFGLAYVQQADRVDELESQNESILNDHHAIGAKFAEQTKKFAAESGQLEAAIRSSYGQGFLAGQESLRLPVELRTLARYAAAGVLVPRRTPAAVADTRPRVEKELDGYTIRWRRLALFASRSEPLSDWTRQALGGLRRVTLGPHRVQRLTGPNGVIYAWRKRGVTYAVIALPTEEPAARQLVASTR